MTSDATLASYAGERLIHDADSHIMDDPNEILAFAPPSIRARFKQHTDAVLDSARGDLLREARERRRDTDWTARDGEEIMLRKRYLGLGATDKADRRRALDHLGFRSQLVFNTFGSGYILEHEMSGDFDYAYAIARVINEHKLDFCSVDPRLLAVCYVPIADFDRTERFARETLEAGAKALLIPSACPANHSPSHPGLDPLWAQAQEAEIPVVFHVGGQGRDYFNPTYFENGAAKIADWLGGDENFRSVSYMAIPKSVEQTLATMALDGVFDRFPRLKIGVVEMGVSWVPSFLRYLDSSFEAFRRTEEKLQGLSLRPSEFIRRQVRVTPYPTEDVGWVMANGGEDVVMFASDFPHAEGGRNPIKRFDTSLEGNPAEHVEKFYSANMIDLMGAGLAVSATD